MFRTTHLATTFVLCVITTNLLASDTETEIRGLLGYFADEWNQGELVSIESSFHPDFLLITSDGNQTREQRLSELAIVMTPGNDQGTLSFIGVKVRTLGEEHAVAWGQTRLKFKDGTELEGIFSTVYVQSPFGWKALITHE